MPQVDAGESPYRPGRRRRQALGLDEGGYAVRLGTEQALLWSPNRIRDARATLLAESADEAVGLAAFRAIADVVRDGRTLPQRVGTALASLLVAPPAERWRPLVETREGVLEVRCGPPGDNLLWRHAGARGGVDVQDDFNRAAADLAGSTTSDSQATWAEDQGTGWVGDGDEADLSGNVSFCVGRLSLAMDSADHYAEADLSRFSRAGGLLAMGVTVRADATPTSGYSLEVFTDAGGSGRRLYDLVDDSTIASDTTAPATGLLYLEFDGSSYSCKVGGVEIFSGTDTTHSGASIRGVGIAGFSNNAGNSAGFTSFRAADLGAGVTGWGPLLAGARSRLVVT